jgi:5'(3')-deoxyribonucleotidase
MTQRCETVVVKSIIRNITDKGFWIGEGGPRWGHDHDVFVPRSQIIDADVDLDDVTIGEEIEIEIPRWLAHREGLI